MNNLPIPQSRSEELMNAFIQRDSSQISTPQSRIEEFWYHLIEGTNSLPIPQSRNELLLKKIIENDTHQIPLAQSRTEEFLVSILTGDINKLPIPQSRSEYYLDYIARNNLLLNDIDYVRYSGTNITATNTVQKPFRSAILKGQTLNNIIKKENKALQGNNITENENDYTVTGNAGILLDHSLFKPSTIYTAFLRVSGSGTVFVDNAGGYYVSSQRPTYDVSSPMSIKLVFTTKSDFSTLTANVPYRFKIGTENVVGSVTIGKEIMVLEGDYTNVDIPYFTGMQSVKMPVLTTSNQDNILGKCSVSVGSAYGGYIKKLTDTTGEFKVTHSSQNVAIYFGGVNTIIGRDKWCYVTVRFGEDMSNVNFNKVRGWTLLKDNRTLVFKELTYGGNGIGGLTMSNDSGLVLNQLYTFEVIAIIPISSAWTFDDYEPYKTNILTTPQDVVLRGIPNGKKDELNLITGELTINVSDELILDGSEAWHIYGGHFYTYHQSAKHSPKCISNWLPSQEGLLSTEKKGISFNNGVIRISLDNKNDDIQVLKNKLKETPLIVRYELETPVIKTVDLKVVNQDGNQVKELSAFDGTTHIVSGSASDNSLIAITEVEVPTKLIEVLDGVKSLSSDVEILINEVDNTQKLQDENSTMAMSAMTELYEMILMMGGND